MSLVSGPAFVDLFRSFAHTARRLETRDWYDSPSEYEPMRRFLAGEPEDMAWFQNWTGIVKQAVTDGRTMRRVRVVSLPLSDYARYGLDLARHNNAAGEDIRYLDRRDAAGLPEFDFWVFDSNRVAKLHFTDDDKLLGAEIITGPAVVVECSAALDDAFHRSVSRDEFAARIQSL
ncbi:hypothetical protein GCM10009555_074930 [Acrocarpospora macrocephala]|uniref:DUF6879 domain-containing protein n=1 Tax=Acrocarpospora macrocephala TaxID=150177 RepID=A0A5M3WZ72_9ACTN|nr:DUF6879 family protein [Acrocarpospora macrocephala]GES11348.1 hypothetical protein Amac_049450 [Acrocarpospora macrocephala]